jgi:hypothetical protein
MDKPCLINHQAKKEEDVMRSNLRIISEVLLGFLLAVSLTACGGGGGGNGTTTVVK